MKVGLFVPCYVDAMYPEAGIATFKLLKHFGIEVIYPEKQTCCGQPMGNAGFEDMAEPLAKKFNDMFTVVDYVVAPSASCASYVKFFHPRLLKGEHPCLASAKTMDIVAFLHDVLKIKALPGSFPHVVSVHNSCHGVRLLHLSSCSEQNVPYYNKMRNLLSLVEGVEVVEPIRPDECCGFGGMFSVEESAVSVQMTRDKVRRHLDTGAEYITGADSSCLMSQHGIISAEKLPIKTIHIVEILAAGL